MSKFNKKSNEQLVEITIINLILIGLILVTILAGVVKISNNTIHVERSKVRDFALLYDSLNVNEQNFKMQYNIPNNYTLKIIPPACTIEIKNIKNQLPTKYYCREFNENIALITENDQIFLKETK